MEVGLKVEGRKKSMKSINIEGGFFFWRVEFFKISKHDFTFIREMRVHPWITN